MPFRPLSHPRQKPKRTPRHTDTQSRTRRRRRVRVQREFDGASTSRVSSHDMRTVCVAFHRLATRFATVIRVRAIVIHDARERARAPSPSARAFVRARLTSDGAEAMPRALAKKSLFAPNLAHRKGHGWVRRRRTRARASSNAMRVENVAIRPKLKRRVTNHEMRDTLREIRDDANLTKIQI